MRHTARGILVNRVTRKFLLIHYLDLKSESTKEFEQGFWVFPGGGVEKHETFQECLKREIYEETGIENCEIQNCVLSRVAEFDLVGHGKKLFYERYYYVETDEEEVVFCNLEDSEKEVVVRYKWWSIEELLRSDETVFPLMIREYLELAFENKNYCVDMTDLQMP